ncbi:MAG: sigma-70 family RNA polymerase sigma factor [Clostridia bacterium]|nr:sigma-70 family RNA polymerase sigma factor [Clostridia bacterium]
MQEIERDEALVLRARKGEGDATEELLLRYKDMVRAIARRHTFRGNESGETEDLVQEGMIGLYAAIKAFQGEKGKTFKNFAYLCVKGRIIDANRASLRRVTLDEGEFDFDSLAEGTTPEDTLLYDESNTEFHAKLSKSLSDLEFRVLTLYLEGMSYSAIAEHTGKDMKSIDNALARAKKKLQKSFS